LWFLFFRGMEGLENGRGEGGEKPQGKRTKLPMMVGTPWAWKDGTASATAPMMARLENTPMTAQKIMARLPNGCAGGWVRYPRKWAMGAGIKGRADGGKKGLMCLSMSKCHRDGPPRAWLGGIIVVFSSPFAVYPRCFPKQWTMVLNDLGNVDDVCSEH
jgi:hypothetical protein